MKAFVSTQQSPVELPTDFQNVVQLW